MPLMRLSDFHGSKDWQKAAKEHKTNRCIDCGTDKDITSGHILPVSRFKMSRLWKSCLVYQCQPCNAKLGNKIRWSLQAIKLLGIYGAMKFIQYLLAIMVIATLLRYQYLDVIYNNSTITDQIQSDIIHYYHALNRDI